ncbi:MAG: hypothetical protein LBF86_01450 [Helicobacteraceae bacterium]|jgi:hypothetical protein|nr:hypothetical protein [Helicobacteraceae bacterium]
MRNFAVNKSLLTIFVVSLFILPTDSESAITLRGDDLEALRASARAITRELSPTDQQRFIDAFTAIERAKLSAFIYAIYEFERKVDYEITYEEEKRLSKALEVVVQEKQNELIRFLDGKSAQEIIQYADQIGEAEYKADISQITTKILNDLNIKLDEFTKERGDLKKLTPRLVTIRGKVMAAKPITTIVFDRAGTSYNITIRAYNSASPDDEQGSSRSAYPNALSLRSWSDPILSRDSNADDQARGSTALALILDHDDHNWDRDAWTTKALGAKTAITGPATGKLTDKNKGLNTDKYWLYDPNDFGTIRLQTAGAAKPN